MADKFWSDTTTLDFKDFWAAKGDLVTATAENTPVILSVGADGEMLTPKASNTNGLEWMGQVTYGGQTVIYNGSVVLF